MILATARELLILDGAIDSSTLEVMLDSYAAQDSHDSITDSRINDDANDDTGTNANTNTNTKTAANADTSSANANVSPASVPVPRKRKRASNKPTMTSSRNTATTTSILEAVIGEGKEQGKSEPNPSAETLAEFLLRHCQNSTTSTNNDHSDSDGTNDNDNDNNRVRKVSDAGLDATTAAPLPMRAFSMSPSTTGTNINSPFAAHLAVAAINININLNGQQQQTIDIESYVKRFVVGHDRDNEETTLLLNLRHELPQLLDLSIMVESHLRQIALNMIRHFTQYISEKALREFLGYKSPTAKNERVLELISDFMFDVSHAKFAWDKTEHDMFGNETIGGVKVEAHDSTICNTLFDSRALRKIGGFEPTSLLSHALSIKRLREKGESWAHFAKTLVGKKMFSHHRDNLAKVQAGARRRDKRMKKNLAVCYPITDDRDRSRSRSSSIASLESGGSGSGDLHISTAYPDSSVQQPSCISPIVPNLIPITITREAGKSWGILLAREGSMCVVMRVPDATDANLQRGDLIVSIRNERNEYVNTPTSSNDITPEWFSDGVGIFKRSNTLHLEVRRVTSA